MGNPEVTHDLLFLLNTGCPELLIMTSRAPHALVPNYLSTSDFLPRAHTHAESMQFCRYAYAVLLQTVVPFRSLSPRLEFLRILFTVSNSYSSLKTLFQDHPCRSFADHCWTGLITLCSRLPLHFERNFEYDIWVCVMLFVWLSPLRDCRFLQCRTLVSFICVSPVLSWEPCTSRAL